MEFWYTKKVAYLLLILTLILPFGITYLITSPDNYAYIFMAALWGGMITPDTVGFGINPSGIIYVIWFFPSLYIAKIAYDSAKKGNWAPIDYAVRCVIAIILQIVLMILIPFYTGSPTPLNIPLPISAVIALLLTPFTVKESTSEDKGAFLEEE